MVYSKQLITHMFGTQGREVVTAVYSVQSEQASERLRECEKVGIAFAFTGSCLEIYSQLGDPKLCVRGYLQ
jgi:hypothetical protein